MPLIDDPAVGQSLFTPRGYIPLPGSDEETNPAPPPKEEEIKSPSFFGSIAPGAADSISIAQRGGIPELFAGPLSMAALQEDNTIGSAIAKISDTWGVSNELNDPNYSPWTDVAGTKYEKYWKNTFAYSNNPQYTAALKHSIDRQEKARDDVRAGGALGTIAGITAGAVDPTILLPVGGEVSLAGKGVWTLGKGALQGARAGAIGTAAYETALQASQDIRTPEQSFANISTGIVLGAVLGGTIAGALTRTQRVASEEGLERIANMPVPGSAGAAAPKRMSLDDLTINNKLTENIAAGTSFSPNLRGNFRESPLARQTYQELATNTLRQGMHLEGLSLGPSVETNINVSLGETIGQALEHHPEIFREGKKAGFGLSSDMFDEEIGRAMRREDVGPNDFVSKAAKMWRSSVVDPLTKQAVDIGLLPEDVSVTEAPSYFSRMYNTEKMVAQKPQFMQIATDFYNETLQSQFAKSTEKLQTRTAAIDEELSNLKLSPEERVQKLDALATQREELHASNANESEIADAIRNARAEARKAKESGDTAGEQVAKDKIEQLQSAGGEGFQNFKKEEAKLKKVARQIGLGYAGMQEKANALSQQLTDLSHTNFRQLGRLVKRGQQLATELKKLDPEKVRTKVSDLRSEFYGLVTRSEQAQDRLAKQIEKLRGDEDKKVQSVLTEAGLNKEKLNKTEVKKAAKIEKEVRETNTAITERLSKTLNAESVRTERLSKISDRLQAAEAIDSTADLNEVRNAVDELTQEISNKALGRGEKAADLLERLSKVDPSKVDEHVANLEQLKKDIARKHLDTWEIKRLGNLEGETPDFSAHAKDMAQEVYDSITGNDYGSASVDPQFHLAARSGPLKDRTFHIPDERIEPFLENNVVRVMTRFARQMSAQVELARKFPGDNLLAKRFENIKNEYDILANSAKTEAERVALDKDRKGAFHDLRALLEIHRGSYMAKENASSWGRTVRGLMLFNFVRSMGGSAIPSLSDVYGPAIFHGLTRTMQDGIPALLDGITKAGPLAKEAHLAGVAERFAHHRLLTLSEIGDPYAKGNAVERLMQNGMQAATKWTGLNMLTDFEKVLDAHIVQKRMFDGLTNGKDETWLAQSGMGPETRDLVREQLAKYSEQIDGELSPNTDQWDSFDAVRAWRAAVNFNVNADIVTRGVGDVPLFAYTPTGKLLLQFKTFNLAAHQRTFLRASQLGPAQFMSGLIGLTTLGMIATTLRAWRGGEENWNRFKESAQNPGYMIGEGLDATGFFTLPIEIGNLTEKLTAPSGAAINPVKTPLMLAGRLFNPDASLQGNTQRFVGQGPLEALAGPSGGILEDLAKGPGGIAVDKVTGEPVTQGEKGATNRLVPFGSYLGMRELIQVLEGNSPYDPDKQLQVL